MRSGSARPPLVWVTRCTAALILAGAVQASAQQDTLIFANGDVMVGEIKSMDRGVAVVSTDYSDSDFKVSWVEVARVHTTTTFLVMLSYDRRFYGTLHSRAAGSAEVRISADSTVEYPLDEIVFLSPIEETFFERLYASIDIGFSLTKANNLRQLSTRSTIGYREERWGIDVALNSVNSNQTDVEPTKRTEGSLNYRYLLPGPWYSVATVSALTNTEQKLDLRLSAQLAGARFFLRTNSAYLGVKIGANRNIERYSSEEADRSSWEGLLGVEFNIYAGGDLDFLANVTVYPSFTQKGRWRTDFNTDLKYDLPLDFYINLGISFNFDNRPAEGASQTDYVLQSGFGWEW